MTMKHRLYISRSVKRGSERYRLRGTLRGMKEVDLTFSSRKAAEDERTKIEAEYMARAGLDEKVLQEARLAHDLLQTTRSDAKGISLLEAVRWFLANYRCRAGEMTVKEYAEIFLGHVQTGREERTLKEAKFYLGKFTPVFGSRQPSSITFHEIETHLLTLPSRPHRDKVLRGFFAWLTGRSRYTRLPKAPLDESPFAFIPQPKYRRTGRPLSLTVDEAQEFINAAARLGILPHVMFGMFAGLRPEAELPHFLEEPKFDFDRHCLTLSGQDEHTKYYVREVPIRQGLESWLIAWKGGFKMTNLTRKLRQLKAEVLPEEKRFEKDILRHTFLTALVALVGPERAAFEGKTSIKMLLRHYVTVMTREQAEAFFNLRPETPATAPLLGHTQPRGSSPLCDPETLPCSAPETTLAS